MTRPAENLWTVHGLFAASSYFRVHDLELTRSCTSLVQEAWERCIAPKIAGFAAGLLSRYCGRSFHWIPTTFSVLNKRLGLQPRSTIRMFLLCTTSDRTQAVRI